MGSLEEALQQAKYNEAVVVTVPDESCSDAGGREMVLIASLDEECGGVVWKNVTGRRQPSAEADELDEAIVRHLRTKRWFLPMLNDHRRNELYDLAIAEAALKAANNVIKAGRENVFVLDIGTGTGLLAMMAARHCRTALDKLDAQNVGVKVISVEMTSAMARLARLTIAENELDDMITVVEGHSADPNFILDDPADLCTSELLESGLLAEGWLPAMRDAWERHLRPDAAIVPMRARVYAQILEGRDSVACYRGPSAPDSTSNDKERLCLSSDRRDVLLSYDVTVPIKAESLFTSLSDTLFHSKAQCLSEPTLVLDLDLSNRNMVPPPTGNDRHTCILSTATGTAHGVLFWWELDMGNDNMTYTTEAGEGNWQDHWQQCLYVFGADDDECAPLKKGGTFVLKVSHNDYSLSFSILDNSSVDASGEASPTKQSKVVKEDTKANVNITPERALQLNDAERNQIFRKAVQSAIRNELGATLLDLSDFSLLGILSAVQGATNVTSLESSTCSGNLPLISARVAQLGNNLPRQRNTFQIIHAYVESLELSAFHPDPSVAKPKIVVAEPYYAILEGWHLQEALNLYYVIRALRRRGILSSDGGNREQGYTCTPRCAKVMGCAIQLDDIAPAYSGLKRNDQGRACIRGYRHEAVDKHGSRYHKFDANFPLSQYRHRLLSAPFQIAKIPYCTDETVCGDFSIKGNGKWSQGTFTKPGTCHALVYWIEYGSYIDSSGTTVTLSTFTRSHKQAIRMLHEFVAINADDIESGSEFCCKATFGGIGNGECHDFELLIKKK